MTSPLLERNLPQLSTVLVREFVLTHYDIDGDYHPQVSERDLSWRITQSNGQSVVLKVSNAAESQDVVDMQIQALRHLEQVAPELPVPLVLPTVSGDYLSWIQGPSGERYMLRMLNFVPGVPFEDVPQAHCSRTRYNLGAMMGRVTRAMQGFFHPAARSNPHLWDISRALELRPYLDQVQQPK